MFASLALLAVLALPQQHYGDDSEEIVAHLMETIDPTRPENAYMPKALKQKLAWVLQERRKEHLRVLSRPYNSTYGPEAIMNAAAFRKNSYSVYVYVPTLLETLKDHLTVDGFDEFGKNFFAIALAHEAIHLEVVPTPDYGPEDLLREEERVWRKTTIDIVRPLRKKGVEVHPDLVRVDEQLRLCGDKKCPSFTAYLRKIYRITQP